MVELSVIVPCYNEAANVPALVERVGAVLRDMVAPGRAEIVLVDDGSRDGTFEAIERARAQHDFVVGARHPRNRGLAAAWRTGLETSRGVDVCILDADLQYRPEELPRLFAARARSGADVAQGWRSQQGRKRDARYVVSRGLSGVLNTVFAMRLRDNKSGFVLCRREVLADLLDYRGRYTYWQILLLVAAHTKGYRICEVETPFDDRNAGQSFLPAVPVLAIARACADVGRAVVEYRLARRLWRRVPTVAVTLLCHSRSAQHPGLKRLKPGVLSRPRVNIC